MQRPADPLLPFAKIETTSTSQLLRLLGTMETMCSQLGVKFGKETIQLVVPAAVALTVSLPKMHAFQIMTTTNIYVKLLLELVWFCGVVYMVKVTGSTQAEFLNKALNFTLLFAVQYVSRHFLFS